MKPNSLALAPFEQISPTDATIRIMSAREAERAEIKDYEDTPR